jgi:alanine-synthesizing transaminase
MFSNRLEWNAPANALGVLLAEKRAAGDTLLDLTQSNPTQVGLDYPAEAILAALSRPAAMVYQPDPRGLMAARQSIAGYYSEQGADIAPDALFLTASTSDAYGMLFKLLGDPGDEVLVPRPGYPLLSYLTAFEGLGAVAYPLRYDAILGWRIDLDLLQALITPKTRAVVIVSPNNPTGAYASPEELEALDQICRRHGLAMIVDEVFADFPATPPPAIETRTALAGRTALTFVLNGFSKMLALPQVKLGWIAVGGAAPSAREAGTRLETLLDFYLSVAAPVQHAAAQLLALRKEIQRRIVARISQNSLVLRDRVAQTANCRMLPRQGGWYGVLEITDTLGDEERVLRLLARGNTVVHPGYFYDFNREGFVVVSLLPRPETFAAGVSNIIAFFGRK